MAKDAVSFFFVCLWLSALFHCLEVLTKKYLKGRPQFEQDEKNASCVLSLQQYANKMQGFMGGSGNLTDWDRWELEQPWASAGPCSSVICGVCWS